MSKRVLAAGKIIKGVPVSVMAFEALAERFELPQKKTVSKSLAMESRSYTIKHEKCRSPENSLELTRQATMAAVTSTYLRAVIAIFFGTESVTIKVIHPVENRLDHDEVVGGLLLAYQSLMQSPFRDTVYFREVNATHMLEGSYFADSLIKNLEAAKNPEVLVINVHHDYLRLFHNLSDFQPILQIIKGISGDRAT